ncbi:MAG: type IV secretion system protein [Candidatus Vogelbacteria bacterium]
MALIVSGIFYTPTHAGLLDPSIDNDSFPVATRYILNAADQAVKDQNLSDMRKTLTRIEGALNSSRFDTASKNALKSYGEKLLPKIVEAEERTGDRVVTAAKVAKAGECTFGWTGISDWGVCIKTWASWVGAILLWLFSWVLRFANQIFNQAINISVRTFSNYAGMDAVKVGWSVIRDLVNMGFIFVLLYIAISTILGVGANDWKKLVPKLIIVALLVNFSMFFTRVIIDVSNVTANQFYTSAAQGTTPSKIVDGQTVAGAPDVTTALMKGNSVFKTVFEPAKEFSGPENPDGQPVSAGSLSWTNIIGGTFGGVALILVASFVFLAGAVLFILRSLRLLFLIILSPFAFFFFILPKTEKYTTQWWEALVSDALFAPAFLIMIYIVTKISGEIGNLGSAADNSVISFMLLIGLLLGALIVAKKLGAMGASKVSSIGKKLGAFGAGALVGGGLGFAGRHTIGRLGNAIGESDRMAKWASKGGAQGWIGRLGMRGGEKIGKASFDVRASKIARGAGLGSVLGGKAGGKGGYTSVQDAEGKRDKETYEKIKAKFGADSKEANEYALTIGNRMGAGQRTKTGAAVGAAVGAGVVGAFTGGVGAPLGAVVGGVVGAGVGAVYALNRRLRQKYHLKQATKFEEEAKKARAGNDLKKAEANEQQAERSRQKAEHSTTVTNRETKEKLGKFEEKKLGDEIKKINDEIKDLGKLGTGGTSQGQAKIKELENILKEKRQALEILTNKKQASEAREAKAAEEKKLKDAIKAGIIEDKESGGGKAGGGEKPPEEKVT